VFSIVASNSTSSAAGKNLTVDHFIETHGYLAIFLGCLVQGKAILIAGGLIARHGELIFWLVVLVGSISTFLIDQGLYYLGHIYGTRFAENHPHLKAHVAKSQNMLEMHPSLLIMFFRFVPGIRFAAPFVVGTSHIKPMRFLILDLVSVAFGVIVLTGFGYGVAKVMERLFQDARQYEIPIAIAVVVVALPIVIIHHRTIIREHHKATSQ
jgi:membrane protein DedA with SNARE-associated domain